MAMPGSQRPCQLNIPVSILLLSLGVVAGCQSRPRAPALSNGPVYQNAQAGFRFLVPEDWTQQANATIPPGKAEQERLMVEYRLLGSSKSAALQVTAIDLPNPARLDAYLTGPAFGVEHWQLVSAAHEVAINGTPAHRFSFRGRQDQEEVQREVLAFQRGERTYLFTAFFAANDAQARDQVRRTLESVIWKD